jgi:hypothetical protein
MRRIVLDTSVVVAGLRTQCGAGNALLRLVVKRRLAAGGFGDTNGLRQRSPKKLE